MSRIIEAEIKEVIRKYPLLKFFPPNTLQGQIELVIQGKLYHQFELTILVHPYHEFRFPTVWENGGEIPRVVDRHVFPEIGNLCFGVRAEEKMICSMGITLVWFIDKVLMPRLADEYCVMNGGEYQKERSHGVLGDWEFYFNEFNTENPVFVLSMLVLLKLKIFLKPIDTCLCGSGNSFEMCHQSKFERILMTSDKIPAGFWDSEIQKLKISRR